MNKFNCIDKHGHTREFNYSVDKDLSQDKWTFRVYNIPPLQSGDFFEISVEQINNQEVRIIMMNNYGIPEYSGAGISDYMIPEISQVLGAVVVSSSNLHPSGGVYRTPDATKVWERLKANGKAVYDSKNDVYKQA
ncbi:MAG: hypothetical protein ABFS08_03210 [Pseudomonadota bacterium]